MEEDILGVRQKEAIARKKNKDMVDLARSGMVKGEDGKLKKRERAKPLWMLMRDQEVIRLMHILQNPELVAAKVNQMEVMQIKGRKVGVRRINAIVAEYRDSHAMIGKDEVNSLVAEARDRYTLLINEAMRMISEAYAVADPEAKLKAKGLALERARQSQQALDNLLKMAGIYREQKDININVNIKESDEWIKLEETLMLFFKYGSETPIDPMKYLEFIEKCENDPIYLQYLKNRTKEEIVEGMKKHTTSDVVEKLGKFDPQGVIDAEFTDIGGEDGSYEQEGQMDLEPRTGDEEEGDEGEGATDDTNTANV